MNESNNCQLPVEKITPLLLQDLPPFSAQVEAIIVLTMCTVALVVNFFVGIIISLTKNLRIRPFILSLQILIINVLHSLTRGPVVFVTGIFQSWLFGKYGCQIVGLILLQQVSYRWLIMFTITLDRFLSVFMPFKYPKIANRLLVVLSVSFWICSLLYSVVPLTGFGCYTFSVETLTCKLRWVCPNAFCYAYYIGAITCVFLVGGIVPTCMYVIMLYRAWKLRRSVTLGQLDSEQDRRKMTESDKRAIITFFALFVALVGLSVPLFAYVITLLILRSIPGTDSEIHIGVIYLIYDIYILLPIADALILSWNKNVKEAIKNVIKKCTKIWHDSTASSITPS